MTPRLTVTFWMISEAPSPCALSSVAALRSSTAPTLPGGGVSMSSKVSSSAASPTAILVALSVEWV